MTKKLIILVPDKNTRFMLEGLLSRSEALGIQKLTSADFDIFSHPLHDPGVFNEAVAFLRPYQTQYQFALVFLDREGSGQEKFTADEIAVKIQSGLAKSGWEHRADVIVFEPELEIWAWVPSHHLAAATGWENLDSANQFLFEHGFRDEPTAKPKRPKEAFELLLREKRIQRSSAIYKAIASQVSFRGCADSAFLKFRKRIQEWFCPES